MTENTNLCQIYFKKLFSKKVLAFIDLLYRNHYIRYFIYSDCMWRHVCTILNFYIVYSKENFFLEFFFLETLVFIRKNKSDVSHLKVHWCRFENLSIYVCVYIKTIPWKFRILNPKNSRVIFAREVCKFLKK